eukprot:jgi/Bigna1/137811/aug1.41_g12519
MVKKFKDVIDEKDYYIDEKLKVILITIRGTVPTSMGDLYADYKIAWNNLQASHSLGGAIVNEFIRRYPFIKYATTFNGASQPQDIKIQNNDKVKRIYINKDFLYRLNNGYRYDRLKVLKYNPEQVRGFFNWIKRRVDPTPTMIKAHSLDQPAFRKLYNYEDGNPTILRNDYVEGGCKKKKKYNLVSSLKSYPLSNYDLTNAHPNIRITTSADLPKLRFADQLFNGNIGVLLWLNEENSGHWTDKSNATCGRWVLLRFILQRAKQSIDYNKKKMNEYINGKSLPNILPPDTPTGAFNRLHIQSLHSAMPIDSNSAYATTKRGSGRYYNNIFKNMLENKRQFFAERDALKQGLSVVKEDEEKPATEKESIFKGESVYVKMLNQVVDLFEEGDYSEIKLTYLRNAYSQLKKEYNTIKKDDVVKYAKFIASVMKYHFEGNKTFTRNVGGKQLRVTAKSFPKSKLMVFFKILNLSVIILGNKNKSDEELKIVIEGSSKMLNAPKTPQAGRDLYNDLKSKYNVSIPTIDLTNTIEASLGAEVDKSVRDKEIDSVAKELRSSATSNRQGDKKM